MIKQIPPSRQEQTEVQGHAELQRQLTERLALLLQEYPLITKVDRAVSALGGTVVLVGGIVRDLMMKEWSGQHSASSVSLDIDVEVFGLSLEQLSALLAEYGLVTMVGVSFGVLRIAGVPIDWSIPRADKAGRKPEVTLVPSLSIAEALRRRDLTMNAMAIEVATGVLHDPFNGYADMRASVLRTPDPQFFVQDPLRFYRVMQLVSRFNMMPDAILQDVCMSIDLTALSRERIVAEFEKLLVRARPAQGAPSYGIRWIASIGRLAELLPELGALCGVLQDVTWHPEGDVFEHTMQVIDAAAALEYATIHERKRVLYACLCHDLGKATTTRVIAGRIRSHGHDVAGVVPARHLLPRIAQNKEMMKAIALLVRHHMAPGQLVAQKSHDSAYKRLAYALSPTTTLYELALVAYADRRGRNAHGGKPLPVSYVIVDVDTFVEKARLLGVLHGPEKAVLTGEDIEPYVPVGPQRGVFLKKAYHIQINSGIVDKKKLLQCVLPMRVTHRA